VSYLRRGGGGEWRAIALKKTATLKKQRLRTRH